MQKQVQRRILRLIQFVERPEWVIAGTKEKSYIDNGKFHLKSNYALMVDIKKFYDNCQREYVYRFFRNRLLNSPDVAEILTNIVTYEGGIPTGCPTSQLLAYYAYEDMFTKIKHLYSIIIQNYSPSIVNITIIFSKLRKKLYIIL